MKKEFDVIIIGGGPAGTSASIYTSRANLNTLVLDKGDNILKKFDGIENYYGFPEPISGKKLIEGGKEQSKKFGTTFKQKEVLSVEMHGENFKVETAEEEYITKSLLLATGVQQKKPSLSGLEELEGKGVSYCVVCDAPLYKGKKTAVLGSKDYAAKEALKLNEHAEEVEIYPNNKEMDIKDSLKKEIDKQGIEIDEREIKEIIGDEELKGIKLGNEKKELDGLFVSIGTSGTLDFARSLGLEIKDGFIEVNEDYSTGMPKIYAAGDCIGGERQIAVAVGEGAEAGINLIEEIKGEEYSDWKK